MLSRARGIALAVGLVAAAACAGQHVSTDYSPSIDFSHYRTFVIVARPDSSSHELLDDRVRHAIESQLPARGLTQTDRASADLYVGCGVVDRRHKEVYTTGWGWGPGWGWGSYRWGVAWPLDLQRSVETYTDGTVVICIIDAKTKQLVWEGQAADVLSLPVSDPVKATQRIDQAVARLLAKYPSQAAA